MKDGKIKGKRLLILGGMRIHSELVKSAQARGAQAIVIDYYDNFVDSPAKALADEHYVVSTTDVEAVVRFVKEKKIDGILMGYADSILPYFAEICEKSGLPCYGTKEQFVLLSHKKKYKKLLENYGVPVVEGYELKDGFTEDDTMEIEYPVLVKPSDGSGSRGIRVCNNFEELKSGYNFAKSFSKCGDVIVERYLTGDEIVAFWFFQKGKAYLTAFGNWHKKAYYEGVNAMGVAYTFPSIYLNDYEKNVVPNAKRMFEEIGIKEGMLFMQCFIDKGVAKCYDIGFRLTGTLDYKIINAISGFDTLDHMMDYALLGDSGESVETLVDPHFGNKYGWNISFLMKPGKLARIEGYEDVLNAKGVAGAVLAHGVGDVILESECGLLKQVVLRVLGSSNSKEEMAEDMMRIHGLFHIYDENGKDLLMPPVDIRQYFDLIENK